MRSLHFLKQRDLLYFPPNPSKTKTNFPIINRDDAGATEVRFILDPKTYNTNCLTHEGQVQYQGPALLCWNNSTFKDADFQSLSDIENSGKLEDETKTGKFGKGFNSVTLLYG